MNEKNQKMIRKLEQANFSEKQITIRLGRKNCSDFYAVIIHDPGISVFEIEELLAEYGEPQYNDVSLCHFKAVRFSKYIGITSAPLTFPEFCLTSKTH